MQLKYQPKCNVRYSYLKVCARDCGKEGKWSLHGYVYSENISKFLNGNTHCFSSQNDQRIEKTQISLELYRFSTNNYLRMMFYEWCLCVSPLCCYWLFTTMFFACVLRRNFPCYMYHSSALYGFSMSWSFWERKMRMLPFENFDNFSL